MTVRQLYNLIAALVLGSLAIWAIVWAFGTPEPERKPIPTPPPGYEYCATETELGFCPKGTP